MLDNNFGKASNKIDSQQTKGERLFFKPIFKKSAKKKIPVIVACCILGLIVFRYWVFGPTEIPYADCRALEINQTPPPRPGTSGIVLAGPIIKPLVFKIDNTKAGTRAIEWSALQNMGNVATITVKAQIFNNGRLVIQQLYDGGYPLAGAYIRQCLETWQYTPYMNGTLSFIFRLGANLVQIDAGTLQPNDPSGPPVQIGRLENITGSGFDVRIITRP